jgi:CheY-like chemotaxis protein
MPRFLVVDDDPPSVDAMTQLLRLDGHEVSPFTDGGCAADALALHPFDAIITDLDMPKVDGTEVMRAARRYAPAACLVVVTANARTEHLYDAGACMVHDKPVDYDAVVGAVGECRVRGGPGAGMCHVKTHRAQAPAAPRRR